MEVTFAKKICTLL